MLDDPISEGKRFGFWYCAGFIEHLDDFLSDLATLADIHNYSPLHI